MHMVNCAFLRHHPLLNALQTSQKTNIVGLSPPLKTTLPKIHILAGQIPLNSSISCWYQSSYNLYMLIGHLSKSQLQSQTSILMFMEIIPPAKQGLQQVQGIGVWHQTSKATWLPGYLVAS